MALVVVTGAGAAAWYFGKQYQWFSPKTTSNLITAQVVKGPLEIKVVERGNLESAANVTLTSKVEGTVAIIKIVEEGTRAKKGQLLVELDSSKLRNDATQQEIVVKQAEATQQQAREALEIQKNQNESDIAAAQLKLDLARLDLEKYKLGESVQQKNTIHGEISLAQEEMTRAQEQYEYTKRLNKKGYETTAKLEADRIAVTKAEINLKVAQEKLKVLEQYEYKRQIAEKEANAKEFERELDRVRRKASAALTQAQADFDARVLTANVERTKLERMKEQILACTLVAPQDGLVVYANERSSRGGSQEVMIQEGAQVRERQAIINLPDVSRMRVDARIHESKIDLIQEGLYTRIRIDALPGKVFNGKVDMVSLVPLSGNWPNFNLKEYSTKIGIDAGPDAEALKPGLTAEVEIQVERLENVLLVPIQCIIERGGKHFAFVTLAGKATRREVKIGKTNDMQVEVRDGLNEGETVVQNPRAGLVTMMEALEKEFPAEKAADESKSAGDPAAKKPAAAPGDKPAGSPGESEEDRAKKRKKAQQSGPAGGFDPAAMFKRQDADGDGKLSEAEVSERMRPNFAATDTNGDKFIDQAEFLKAMEAIRARMGSGPPNGAPPNGAPPASPNPSGGS